MKRFFIQLLLWISDGRWYGVKTPNTKHQTPKWLLPIFCFLISVFCFSAQGANYYVDFATGSDANNGTATGTPFKHCPGHASATGTAAATTLSGGDTVFFKGGVNYVLDGPSDYISPTWSGGTGNPITYDGNSAGTWGTGKAIITDVHKTNSANIGFYTTSLRSNLVFRSLKFFEIGGSTNLPADLGSPVAANNGWGILLLGGAYNITVRDCDFSELGYYWNAQPMNSDSIDGAGIIFGYTYNGVIVTNCTFERMSAGIRAGASTVGTNLLITHCEFRDSLRWGVDINVTDQGASLDAIAVRDCNFHDFHQYNQAYWTGYGEFPHTDGIFFRGDYDNCIYGNNIRFFNNTFSFTNGPGGGTACIFIAASPWAHIYNNVFINAGMANGAISATDGSRTGCSTNYVNIFNNTFYDYESMQLRVNVSVEWPMQQSLRVENNIFYLSKPGFGAWVIMNIEPGQSSITNAQANWFFTRNLYRYIGTGGDYIYYNGSEGTDFWNLTNMQSYGWEAQGLTNDPVFVDIVTATPNQDFRLQAGSPALNAGTNLYSFFTHDKDGNTRPATGFWDLGAYVNSNVVYRSGTLRTAGGSLTTSGGTLGSR